MISVFFCAVAVQVVHFHLLESTEEVDTVERDRTLGVNKLWKISILFSPACGGRRVVSLHPLALKAETSVHDAVEDR